MTHPSVSRSIVVQTFDGWDVPNARDADPSLERVKLAKRSHRFAIASSQPQLAPPTGRYNCHGLVFASRRTNIPPAGQPQAADPIELLKRDGFGRVSSPAQVGDVAVYRNAKGEVEHTGFVSRVDRVAPMSPQPVVFVWSMWGGLGEFEHRVNACPYSDCQVEYWRLR